MPVDILVGLQYGSEGKGKISAYLANEYDVSVRVGGWQSGHTFEHKEKIYKMRQLPCQWINPHIRLVIGAGALINLSILDSEIEMLENDGYSIRNRLYIDERAIIIDNDDCAIQEASEGLFNSIGSTQEGVGEALIRKIKRDGSVLQAKDCLRNGTNDISDDVIDTIKMLNKYHEDGLNIFIEGNQGSHLSSTTSNHYPYCTSTDCNASGFLSSCGLSPFTVRNIIGVMRTYPIRVAGNSGNTGGKEISWGQVTTSAISSKFITEKTTVTNRTRRVFEFSDKDILQSIIINKPNILAINFVDYIDALNENVKSWNNLTHKTRNYLTNKKYDLGIEFDFIGTGQSNNAIIDLR